MYSVSVIMPIHNNEETLKETIDSILDQSIYGLELILIDDGSTDSSAQICDTYVKKEPLIVESIKFPARRGFGAARNQGLLKAKGRYIYFANADDVFDSKMLEANIRVAEEKQTDLVVFGFSDKAKGNEGQNQIILPNLPFLANQDQFRRHFRNFYHFYPYTLLNKLYRREYLQKNRISFINIPAREDAFFNLAVFKNINSVAFNRHSYSRPHKNKVLYIPEYKENYHQINVKLAKYFDGIIKSWHYEFEFADLITREFINVVLYELEIICENNHELSRKRQVAHVTRIIEENGIEEHLKDKEVVKYYNPYQRAILAHLSKGQIEEAIKLANRDETAPTTKSKLKNIFRYLISLRHK